METGSCNLSVTLIVQRLGQISVKRFPLVDYISKYFAIAEKSQAMAQDTAHNPKTQPYASLLCVHVERSLVPKVKFY